MSKKKQMGQEHSRDEQTFRESEARQAFLLKLSDAMRSQSDPVVIQAEVVRLLGEHLRVDRCFYCEMEPDGDHMWIRRDYHNGVQSQAGFFRVSEFGPFLLNEYLAGRTVVIRGAQSDNRLSGAERDMYPMSNVRAFVCVPLVKEGRLFSVLAVNQPAPRDWMPDEIALIEEVAERTWAAVERARAEIKLHEAEERYLALFNAIDQGFCTLEVAFDENGKAVDYRFLEVSPNFEQQTGIANAAGRWMREIAADQDEHWFEIYGRVALTGQPARFESYSTPLGRWWYVYAFRIGQPALRRVGVLFYDITDRKRREANFAFLNKVSQDLERLTEVDEIMSSLGARIGEHFKVPRCTFAEIDEAAGEATVRHAWYREGHVDSAGFRTQRLRDFISDELFQTARAGEMMIVCDTRTDPRTDDAAYAPRNTRAFLTVPFLRDGEWRATLSIADSAPRDWRDDEIELMRELTNRIWTRLERARAEEALHESQAQLAVEVQTIRDLYDSSTRLLGMSDINDVLEEFLDSSMRLLGADFGNVQLYNAKRDVLELVTAGGFHPEFIEKFKFVGSADNTACGRAMHSGERIIIEDIKQDALFEPYRQDAAKADYRAVQSTPLVGRQGRLLGMISMHFRAPHRPSEDELRFLDLYVRQTVDFIVRVRSEEELRQHQIQLQSLNETLEQKVQEKTEEVRQLASDVINATQKERQRLSRVLHDDLQQRAYAIQVQLSFLRNELPGENHSARKEVSDIEKGLADIVRITRNLSIDLSPPILPGEGLSHAVAWLASRMREQSGLPIELQANGPFVIPNEELHVFLFNCVRELLFNVAKHAGASQAVVALAWLDHGLRIEVRDDGKGFPNSTPEDKASKQNEIPRSLGLPTIRRQLSLFGGVMEINSEPGAGTQVILIVPVAEASQGVSSSADIL